MLDISDEEDCILSNALDNYENGLSQTSADNPISSNICGREELEVHDLVPVETVTREDGWSIELLNAYQQLLFLHSGHKVREFPIFGNILSSGIGVKGIIDEIRPSLSGGLTIVEMKTRADGQKSVSKSRLQRDALQLMIYKHLFENLNETLCNKELMQEKFHLNFQQRISRGVLDYTRQLHLDCQTFDDILTVVQAYLSIFPLPPIDSLLIEYISQNTGNILSEHSVVWDEAWFKNTTIQMLSFWLGKREAKGVDVEEAYKCLYCPFSDICTWRLEKQKVLSHSNEKNFSH